MNDLWIETGSISMNKHGETLCGDKVELAGGGDEDLTLVLADGLGSGVKANILSTLTSKILCTMISGGIPLEECVSTIASTLPVCSVRKVAYSTFTIIRILDNKTAHIIQFDTPATIVLRKGELFDYPRVTRVLSGKTIWESTFPIELDDVFIAMSDGAEYAGVGDLIVTCCSMHSRNRRCGILIGKGVEPKEAVKEIGAVVEGYYAVDSARELAKRAGVEMPITQAAYQVLYEGRDPKTVLQELMRREKRHEMEETWI